MDSGMRVLRELDGREITLEGPLLGRGGEASVYALPDCPLAAKIYHNPTHEHADKLAAMLALPGRHAVAWPVERLLEADGERRVVGYLMPRLERASLLWEVYNPGVRWEVYPRFHYGSLLRVARDLACAVAALHRGGCVIGDLNESNVLVTPEARVTLIDADSFQVSSAGRLYRCGVGRPEYAPPELQGVAFAEVDRLPEHDAFALAVLIFQLLMQGIHPFAGVPVGGEEPGSIPARIRAGAWPYAWGRGGVLRPGPHAPPWWVLPPAVQELLQCCFEDAHAAPQLRPAAARWQEALEEAEATLTTCPTNAQHLHPRGLDRCPWCVLARQQGRDPFPVLGQAREPRQERAKSPWMPAPAAPGVLREDPVPVRPVPPAGGEAPGWVEVGLARLGAALSRHGWLACLGAVLVGSVAGLLWTLQQSEPARDRGSAGASPSQLSPRRAAVAAAPERPPIPTGPTRPREAGPTPPMIPQRPREGTAPPPDRSPPRADKAARKTVQEAAEEVRQVREAYRAALRAYQKARGPHPEGLSPVEVNSRFLELQAAQRRLQAAQAALQERIEESKKPR